MRAGLILAAILLCAGASVASAGQSDEPICPDRPSKATGACTVPVGTLQIETGLVDWTHDRSDGESTDFTMIGASLIKYGVSDRADVELQVVPLEVLRTLDNHASGFGDVLARVKYRLTAEDAPIEVAIDPFVKLPTARRAFGNGKVEGGVVVPLSADLGKSGLTLSAAPELDLLADGDGRGRHAAMIQVLNLGLAVNHRLALSGELWGEWDWDPAGTEKQASADGAVTYLVNDDLQLDAGANLGLNARTPDIELYVGVSTRF